MQRSIKNIYQDRLNGIAYVDTLLQRVGSNCITYFDIDANNYRTASGNYKIRF